MDDELDAALAALPAPAARAYPLLAASPVHDLTAEAIAAVLDADDAATDAVLDDLLTAYLVVEEPYGRFRMHAALRERARGRAAPEDTDAATVRLIEFYLRMTASADIALNPSRTRATRIDHILAGRTGPFAGRTNAEILAVLDAESDNLPAVVRAAAARGLHTHTWRLAETLTGFYLHHRQVARWIETSELGITAAREAQHASAEARLRTLISRPYIDQGDLDRAGAHLDAVIGLLPEIADPVYEASLYEFRGRYLEERSVRGAGAEAGAIAAEAEAAFLRAEELNERAGEPRGAALAVHFRGCFLDRIGRTDAALDVLSGARDRFLGLTPPDTRMAARALLALGRARAHAGDPSAGATLEEAAAELAGRHYAAGAWEALADLARDHGDTAAERARLARAIDILAAAGHPRSGELQARLDALG